MATFVADISDAAIYGRLGTKTGGARRVVRQDFQRICFSFLLRSAITAKNAFVINSTGTLLSL